MDTTHNAVEVEQLEKKFGNFVAVNKISFSVRKGETFGFLGPNGAGKSTTIRMLCGLLAPTSGKGHVGGCDILTQQEKIKQNIGYMSQKFSLYSTLTVEENIDFYSGLYRIPAEKRKTRKEWVVRMAGLEDLCSIQTSILSGGWKQRLALGCAILHEPPNVFLDEPTSGVDPLSRQRFWDIIKAMTSTGTTVFVTTHYMDEAENCDRIVLIYKGNMIAIGTPLELKTKCMKEHILEIRIARPEEWRERLKQVTFIKESALFGSTIHALVTDAASTIGPLQQFFKEQNESCMIQKIQPSLEDVFVSLVEEYDRQHPS